MVELGSSEIQNFLQQLGDRYPGIGRLYLLGGSALCLLGSVRRNLDIDYNLAAPNEEREQLQATVDALAMELKLDLEAVPLEEFISLLYGGSRGSASAGGSVWRHNRLHLRSVQSCSQQSGSRVRDRSRRCFVQTEAELNRA